jgi:hypothetical protein
MRLPDQVSTITMCRVMEVETPGYGVLDIGGLRWVLYTAASQHAPAAQPRTARLREPMARM